MPTNENEPLEPEPTEAGSPFAPALITSGVMARELRVPLHRVVNVLATRPHIRPAAYAGTLRLYDRRSVALVRQELATIDARRADRPNAEQQGGRR